MSKCCYYDEIKYAKVSKVCKDLLTCQAHSKHMRNASDSYRKTSRKGVLTCSWFFRAQSGDSPLCFLANTHPKTQSQRQFWEICSSSKEGWGGEKGLEKLSGLMAAHDYVSWVDSKPPQCEIPKVQSILVQGKHGPWGNSPMLNSSIPFYHLGDLWPWCYLFTESTNVYGSSTVDWYEQHREFCKEDRQGGKSSWYSVNDVMIEVITTYSNGAEQRELQSSWVEGRTQRMLHRVGNIAAGFKDWIGIFKTDSGERTFQTRRKAFPLKTD